MASQTLRTLKLSLLADVSDFGKGMGKATSDFDKFSKNVATASKVATGVLGVLGGLAASAINAASDLEETRSAIDAVFGEKASRQIQNFARTADRALGQSRQEALSAAQNFGIFGKAAGLADDDLVDFTTTLISLAGDLASFQNTTPEQAIFALGAALRGESEPIRTYGVLLDAATIQQRALSEGLIETEKDAITPAIKTLAIYAEVLAQTQIQQGNFVDTAAGFANTQKTFAAQMTNFKADIGEVLLPILQGLLPELRGIIDTFADADPEKILELGKAIGVLAVALVSFNTALKVFQTLRAAYLLLAANPVIGALVVAGGATAFTAQNLPEGFIGGGAAIPELPGLAEDIANRRGSPGRRPTGNQLRGNVINVSGVVGSPYQVFRELERINSTGQRSASTFSGGNR
jgi:hypothetical protein